MLLTVGPAHVQQHSCLRRTLTDAGSHAIACALTLHLQTRALVLV